MEGRVYLLGPNLSSPFQVSGPCEGGSVQPFGQEVDRPVDGRKYDLFQSAVKAVSKVLWTETEGKDQEHQACYDETCDDKMPFRENATSNAQLNLEPMT